MHSTPVWVAEPQVTCLQVMSVWPFKQMILSAQLKQSPIPSAQSKSPLSVDKGANPGTISAMPSSSSAQCPTISVPRDLVQQKLSGGDSSVQSDTQSDAQPASRSTAESHAAPIKSHQAQEVHRGHERPGSPGADAQSGPGMPGRAEVAGSSSQEPLQTDYLFHFGDTTEIRKALAMPNRLTG